MIMKKDKINEEDNIQATLKEHLDRKTSEELKNNLEEINRKIEMVEQHIDVLSNDLISLRKVKKSIKNMIIAKEDDRLTRDSAEIKDDEEAKQRICSYLDDISKCPYCPMKFQGTPSEKEKARAKHIHDAHPGKNYK